MAQRRDTERNRQNPAQEGNSISTQNFAGLNTVANPLTIPYEDSPIFTNVFTNDRGGVEKRKGTQLLVGASADRWMQPISTSYGYNYYLSLDSNATGIDIDEIGSVVGTGVVTAVNVLNKPNIWSGRVPANGVRPSSIIVSQPGEQQVWLATGVDCPVRLRFIEYRAEITLSGTTTNTLPSAQRLQGVAFSNLLLYVDGIPYAVSSATPAGDDLDVVTADNPGTGTAIIDVIAVVWNWGAESEFYYGDRFNDTVTRYHAGVADLISELPENLTDGIDWADPEFNYTGKDTLSCQAFYFAGGNYHNLYSQSTNLQPTLLSQFCGSTPTIKLAGAQTNFGTNFVQWGALDGAKAATPETVIFHRIRRLNFNGGQSALTQKQFIYVTVGSNVGSNTGVYPPVGSYGDYATYYNSPTPAYAANPTDPTESISFTVSMLPTGLAPNDEVRITYTENVYCGTAATTSPDQDLDGSWFPLYGIGLYADYGALSFPNTLAFYQNRLAMAGCPADPLRVFISSVSDFNTPGEYYQYFTQDVFTTLDTDPLDVVLNTGYSDDRITAMREYQGSLFIGTTTGLYRLSAPSQGGITAANALVATVAREEVFNQQCLLVADDMLFAYTQNGIQMVEPVSSTSSTLYQFVEISDKVHDIFSDQPADIARDVAWMGYSETENCLYVGVTSDKSPFACTRLLRYGLFRQSWSEYTMPQGFNTLTGVTVKTVANDKEFLICNQPYTSFTTNANGELAYTLGFTELLRMDFADFYLDRCVQEVSTGTVGYSEKGILPTIQYTIDLDIKFYRVPWSIHPVSDINDLRVTINGNEITYLEDYVKKDNSIYLLAGLPGDTLDIYYKNPSPNEAGRYLHDLFYDQYLDLSETPELPANNSVDADTLVTYGSTYQSIYSTPLFTWGSLGSMKKLVFWTGLFSNEKFQERWVEEDYNTASSEHSRSDILDKFKQDVDANIAFVYDSDDKLVDNYSDLYNLTDQYYDLSLYDIDQPLQYDKEVNIKQSLQGIGYSFRSIVWNSDTSTFELLAYQLEGLAKGKKSRHWSE